MIGKESEKLQSLYKIKGGQKIFFLAELIVSVGLASYAAWLVMTVKDLSPIPLYALFAGSIICVIAMFGIFICTVKSRKRLKALVEHWEKLESSQIPRLKGVYELYLQELGMVEEVQYQIYQAHKKIDQLEREHRYYLKRVADIKWRLERPGEWT